MLSKLKSILVGLILAGTMSLPLVMPSLANAASVSSICAGASGKIGSLAANSASCTGGGSASTSVDNTISLVLNLFSAIVGIIAVIMIIIGGVKYVTSGGSSEKTTSAKDTIFFAIVGLIVVALAQIIVKFVLHKTKNL